MHPDSYTRLGSWWEGVKSKLRKKWWLWPVLLGIEVFRHWFFEDIVDFLRPYSGGVLGFVRTAALYILTSPIALAVLGSLAIIVTMAVLATIDVRRKPALPRPLPPAAASDAQAVEDAAQRHAREDSDWEMRRNSAIHTIVADYNQAMYHPDNAAQYLAAMGSASAILWRAYTTEQERENGSQVHNAYTSILNAARDPLTISPERLHLAMLDIARLADLTGLVLDPPSGQPAPADAQTNEIDEEKQQRKRAIEHPEVEEVRVVYRRVLGRAVERACETAIDELILARAHGNEVAMLIRRMLNAFPVPKCRHAKERLSSDLAAQAVAPLETIVSDLQCVLTEYGVLMKYLEEAARAIVGPQDLYRSEGYRGSEGTIGLYQMHRALLQGMDALCDRTAFQRVRPSLAPLYDLFAVPPPAASQIRLNEHAVLNVGFIFDEHYSGSKDEFPGIDYAAGEVPSSVGFLVVTNIGNSTVVCHALTSAHSGFEQWPSREVSASWYRLGSSHVKLERGSEARIIIAVLLKASWNYRWSVPYWLEEDRTSSSTASFFRNKQDLLAHIKVAVVTDQPPSVGGLPISRFIVEGDKIREDT